MKIRRLDLVALPNFTLNVVYFRDDRTYIPTIPRCISRGFEVIPGKEEAPIYNDQGGEPFPSREGN